MAAANQFRNTGPQTFIHHISLFCRGPQAPCPFAVWLRFETLARLRRPFGSDM